MDRLHNLLDYLISFLADSHFCLNRPTHPFNYTYAHSFTQGSDSHLHTRRNIPNRHKRDADMPMATRTENHLSEIDNILSNDKYLLSNIGQISLSLVASRMHIMPFMYVMI